MLETIASLGPLLLPLLGGAAGIKFVREGERALVLRFGKAVRRKSGYRVAHPGFAWIIPGVDKFERTHVRQRIINLPSQVLTLSDKTIFQVSAVLRARVKDTSQDLYLALFETSGLNKALEDAGLTAVRDVLLPLGYASLLQDRDTINKALEDALRVQAEQWGVEVLSFKLSDTDPDDETARLIQLGAAAKAKVEAAEEAATALGYASVKELPAAWVASLGGVPQTVTTVTDTHKMD